MKGFSSAGKLILPALLLGVIAALGWFLRSAPLPHSRATRSSSLADSATAPAESSARSQRPPPFTPVAPGAPSQSINPPFRDRPRAAIEKVTPEQKKAAESDPQLTKVASSLRNYRLAYHQNPTGNNADITRTLLGRNAGAIRYLPADAHLNDKNELLDRWDQPLFFHQLSGTVTEVRSAGPDHIMWNADDEVLR